MMPTSIDRVFSVQRSSERAYFDHGWLKTYHSFSFADYYDPRNLNWGALRVLNDDVVAPGEGFPTHPHRDMEIVTYVLSGQLEHKDSSGNQGVVGPGGVQFMSAGTGVRHSEYNKSATEPLHLLQMWVLPGKLGTPPSYGQVDFKRRERVNRLLPVVSGHPDVSAPVRLTQDAAMFVSELEHDHHLRHTFDPDRLGFLFVADGTFVVEGLDEGDIVAARADLATGDAVRIANLSRVSARGDGVFILWDLPNAGG